MPNSQTIADLNEDRNLVEQMFNLLQSYVSEILTADMKKELEDCKWSILGDFDYMISIEKNAQRVEKIQQLKESLTGHFLAN